MSIEKIGAEQVALKSLLDLMDRAQECRRLYERADMALPEPLRRMLGLLESPGGPAALAGPHVPRPQRTPRPPDAEPDWIWVALEDAGVVCVVLAVLREAGGPVRAKDVVERTIRYRPNVPSGSIANVGTRLDPQKIRRAGEGWSLVDRRDAGVIMEGFVWGPPSVFEKYELAAFRRYVILHLLGIYAGGLLIVQILEYLQAAAWLRVPLNKELVQDDVKILAKAGKIRRKGASKKWELAPSE